MPTEVFKNVHLPNRFQLKSFPQVDLIHLKHPILLVHGYGAFATKGKPTQLHDVCMLMRSFGIKAIAPNGAPFATIKTRAENWVDLFYQAKVMLKAEKLNIIAHSMGGLDMRYALSQLDIAKDVESLTTVASPHHGTYLAELALNTPEPIFEKLQDFMNWIGNNLYPNVKSDLDGSLHQLTREYVTDVFNPNTPNHPDIPYYSYSAEIGKGTNSPISPILLFQTNLIQKHEGPNDGIVGEESAHWGEHMGVMALSHLEQIKLNIDRKRVQVWEKEWFQLCKNLEVRGH